MSAEWNPLAVNTATYQTRDLSHNAKLALFVLTARGGRNEDKDGLGRRVPSGGSYASLRTLSEDMDLHVRTVRKALAELVAKGWISMVAAGRQQASAIYLVHPRSKALSVAAGATLNIMQPDTQCHADGAAERAGGASSVALEVVQRGISEHSSVAPSATKPRERTNTEPERERVRADAPARRPPARTTRPKATRMSRDWEPSPEAVTWCTERNVDALACLDEFRDYWIGVPGGKGLKSDWDATFRNRVRRLLEQNRAPMAPSKPALSVVAPPDEPEAEPRSVVHDTFRRHLAQQAKGVPA